MRSGAVIYKVPVDPFHKMRNFRVLYQPPGSFEVHVHNNCLCNEYISLRNRVLQKVPLPDPGFVRECKILAHRIGTWIGPAVPQDGEWIEKYSGRKLTIYRNAQADLLIEPFNRADRFIKSFIKPEKISDPTRDPRTIQARSPRYNYCLGNYLKAIEHKLYNIKGTRNLRRYIPQGRLIAKGLDLRARAYLCQEKMDMFSDCRVFSIDASRFDAHVAQQMLQVEHSVYKRCFPGDKTLQQLLDLQLVNRGHTAGGISYKCPGGRMSGDMNTALGNCLLMLIFTATTMKLLGFKPNQWNMLCDGDDTLIFTEERHANYIRANFPSTFNKAGMTIKLEGEAKSIHDINFCQGKIVECDDGLKFVQNPVRSYSRALVSTRHYQHPKAVDKVLAQIGRCELAINMGVPVLQEFALAMLRNAKCEDGARSTPTFSGRIYKAQKEWKSHGGIVKALAITDRARESFQEAFGIEVWEQLWLESILRAVSF